jgi:hypothetical protein
MRVKRPLSYLRRSSTKALIATAAPVFRQIRRAYRCDDGTLAERASSAIRFLFRCPSERRSSLKESTPSWLSFSPAHSSLPQKSRPPKQKFQFGRKYQPRRFEVQSCCASASPPFRRTFGPTTRVPLLLSPVSLIAALHSTH